MPVLKTQCPKCDTKLRLTVDGPGEHDAECPKCSHEFTATLEEEGAATETTKKPKKANKDEPDTKKADKGTKEKAKAKDGKKARKRADEDEDDEDDEDEDKPKTKVRRKGNEEADSAKTKIIIGVAVAGVLLLSALGGIIYAVTSNKKPAQQTETAQQQPQPQPPGGFPPGGNPPGPNPNPNPIPNPGPIFNPGPGLGGNPNPGTGPNPGPGTVGPNPGTTPNPGTNPPKNQDPQETELTTALPPPPKIKISGSLVPVNTGVVKAPAQPPLAPDEDPFNRAKEFKPDGPLPALPALPKPKDRPLLTLEAGGHTDIVGKVFFTPKGDRVITVAKDKAARIWDPKTNETLKTIRFPAGPGQEGSLQAAALSRTGQRLAVAGVPLANTSANKNPIYIVDPDTGAQVKRLDVGTGPIRCMDFSVDGKWLGVGCDNADIQIVDLTEGKAYPAPHVPGAAPVREVKFNPSQKLTTKRLATLDADNLVQLWTFTSPPTRKLIDVQSRGIPTCLAWSTDGQMLAIGTTTGEIMVGTSDGKLVSTLPRISHNGKPVHIYQLRYLPGDNELVVAGVGGNASGWAGIVNERTGAVRTAFKEHTNVVFALDVSPDGKRIVTSGGSQHETYVWSAEDGKVINRFVGTGNGVWSIAWAKDGKSLAFGHSNKRNENGDGALEHTFRLDDFGVGDDPDPSKYVQTVTSDEHAKIKRLNSIDWGVGTNGREPEPFSLPGDEKVYAATVLPKANAIAFAGTRTLTVWTASTLSKKVECIGHTGNVLCVTPSPDGRLFASGSSDQTIRIWRPDQEDPILSIFVSGRDWIAWTPQGFYACSGQGERLIAWQMAAVAGKVPVVHPAERFRSSMYQPALLKYIVPTGDLPRALAMAQKYDKALIKTANVADVLPPEVTLDGFGETEVKLEKDTLVVRATAKSPGKHPITAMRLLVNGRPFQGSAGVKRFENPQPGIDATATWEVPLPPGTHTVAAIADTPVSKGMSKVGVAVRSGDIPKPNLYVLAVGVGAYQDRKINKLPCAAGDAPLLTNALQQYCKGVFNKIEVRVLTDATATKKGILEGMDWLKTKMTPQDVGIVSFSGHGTRDMFGNFYLCPVDMRSDDEDCATGLSGNEFKKRLEDMPGRLVAILDACHSGTVAEKERPPGRTDALVRDLTSEDSGVIVMCASAGREYAIEDKRTKAGYYTFGLVEGLAGHADIDGDGVIYIHELDMYATARVRQLSGGRQNPTLGRPQTVRPFVIAKPENAPKP